MKNNNNNNNHRAYGHAHETGVCHNGRLGCWAESRGAVAARWARRVVEGLAFAVLALVFCVLCAAA